MNNIATASQALGQHDTAYEWWWKAIQTRPTYWDAIVCCDNVLQAESLMSYAGKPTRLSLRSSSHCQQP
jgi:protein O-GlcNAc transferase